MRQLHGQGRWNALISVVLLLTVGCERAARYGPVKGTSPAPVAAPHKPEPPPAHWAWLEPIPVADTPIVFVDAVTKPKEWQGLPHFWNHFPPITTAHVGMSPLGAVVALHGSTHVDVIKIKVPLGLPDPTPNIPPSNPPTFAKWQLGKRLFFDSALLEKDGGSCASCHRPEEGFTRRLMPALHVRMVDTLSLLNCVYNKSQFWDGRVTALEEVIQRSLEDEQPPKEAADKEPFQYPHAWSGIIRRLNKSDFYRAEFRRVFGIPQPTQDAVGKAVATYMRTILSGNSLYDRAVQKAGKPDDGHLLQAQHFEALLEDGVLARLGKAKAARADVAAELAAGYKLFHNRRVGCAVCHPGWNFTDNSFHNLGIRESDWRKFQELAGRFRHQPIGLKEARMIGAFRTPSLRNLPQTPPYFHDAGAFTLEHVVQYFDSGVDAEFNTHLDPELLAGPRIPKRLDLHNDDIRALVLFLTALDGDPVPAVIANQPRE